MYDEDYCLTPRTFRMYQDLHDTFLIRDLGLNVVVQKRTTIKNYSHLFLTINPPPSMVLMDFQKTIEKTLQTTKGLKLWIEGYLYVLEQR
uniref:hypothetical protein n=1 Tax=Rheinheimera sp. TaxID=1869214 RepID=UPI0040487A82